MWFFFQVFQDLLKFISPQILKQLIKFVQDDTDDNDRDSWKGYSLAVGLFLVNIIQLIILQQYWIRVYQVVNV